LVRDVAYGLLPRTARGEKHKRAAEWIASLGRPEDHAEMVAHHYAAAIDLARATGQATKELEEQARIAFRAAGDKTFALHAPASAASFYEKALTLWPDDGLPREELRYHFGNALGSIGDERAVPVLTEAAERLEAMDARSLAAVAYATLAEYWWFRGKREPVAANIDRAKDLIRDAAPSPEKARVLVSICRFMSLAEEGDRGLAAGSEAIAVIEQLGLSELLPRALMYVGLGKFEADPDAGLRDVERGLELARANKSADVQSITANLGFMYATTGDIRKGNQYFWETVRMESQFGETPISRHTRGARPWIELHEGDWDAAKRHAEEFIAEIEAGNPHYNEWVARISLAMILFARDDLAGALDQTRRGLESTREAKDPQVLVPALAWNAEMEASAGNLAVAESLLDESLQLMSKGHAQNSFYLHSAWLAEELGRGSALLGSLGAMRTSRFGKAARSIVEHDWAEAANLFEEMGLVVEEAQARVRLGEALIGAGRRAEGVEQIERALAFYRSVRATRFIRQAEEILSSGLAV
jgi:tetratricopeptide (TPR) repeat protein